MSLPRPGDATVAAVDATVREWMVCFDANQYARAFALMTDDLIRTYGPQQGETEEEVRALFEEQLAATPVAGATDQTILEGPRDVRLLPDGRVGGIWLVEGDAAFLILERQGDRWLADEVIDIVESGTPAAGTPTA